MATSVLLELKDSVMAMLPDVPLTDAVIFGIHIHGERVHCGILFGVVVLESRNSFC